ncbi:MOSC domain-containing protein [Micromonospora sp. NBRC 101691]|uniref:MOSC domain-containing protein n=1 Tax=Micromonospora sp. NBRC 101691 TaxID=3032198 RepID=UPI0024A1EA89|nr:MOSC domain-containing protein [Micromonospora sp. NBRC 101691]GLY24303.1 molybdenum cofactor biosynthesis protein [Micromonospora sp. NBRC 101691]
MERHPTGVRHPDRREPVVPPGAEVVIVEEIRRYPVKSMLGETLPHTRVTPAGVEGDRRLALRDLTTGRVVSAKHPRRWRAMLTLRAAGVDPVRISLPDGRELTTGDDVDAVLSTLLGTPVTLIATVPPGATLDRARPDEVLAAGVTAPVTVDETPLGGETTAETFVDFAPLHLVTTATLDRIAGAAGTGQPADATRYRPNLVLRTTGVPGFAENGWVGRHLRVGAELVLRVMAPTPRCAVPTLAHGDLPAAPDALRVPARLNRVAPVPQLGPLPCVGAYAQVVHPGRIEAGDPVRLD